MGWFGGAPKSDPIADLCRLLVEKPWEWVAEQTEEDDPEERNPMLVHISGIRFSWSHGAYYLHVWMAPSKGIHKPVGNSDAKRLYQGILGNLAARACRPVAHYDSVVKAMAQAALAGDRTAAKQLADIIMELEGGTPQE